MVKSNEKVAQEITQLMEQDAAGQTLDIVKLVDHLLLIAAQLSDLTCTTITIDEMVNLCFFSHEQLLCQLPLKAAKIKLRMMCARLITICREQGQDMNMYGGTGELACAVSPQQTVRFHLTVQNTSDQQEFTLVKK